MKRMIKESSEVEFTKASNREFKELSKLEKEKLEEAVDKAQIVCEDSNLFLVIDGIAYPAEELAERLPNKLNI